MSISLIEQYYDALLDDSIIANELFVKILEEDEKKYGKNKELKKNEKTKL